MGEITALADTHVAVWYLFSDPRLSLRARDFIHEAAATGRLVAVSSVSLAEIVYLVEKGRLPAIAYDGLTQALLDPEHVFEEIAFTAAVVASMHHVSRAEVPDMPGRMVTATAVHLGVPILSKDGRIRKTATPTIW